MRRTLIALLCALGLFTGCAAPAASQGPKQYQATFLTLFDTVTTILGYAETSRLKLVTICDRPSTLELQRYSEVLLPCHVASFGLGASYTAIGSAIRLLALTYATHAGKTARQRAAIVESIRLELDDLG